LAAVVLYPAPPATNLLPLISRLLQLPVPLGMDHLLAPGKHVLQRVVANGTVEAEVS
jgi:hypothetical protein